MTVFLMENSLSGSKVDWSHEGKSRNRERETWGKWVFEVQIWLYPKLSFPWPSKCHNVMNLM